MNVAAGGLKLGDHVLITSGAFANLAGVIIDAEEAEAIRGERGLPAWPDRGDRVFVLVEIMRHPVPLQVNLHQVERRSDVLTQAD